MSVCVCLLCCLARSRAHSPGRCRIWSRQSAAVPATAESWADPTTETGQSGHQHVDRQRGTQTHPLTLTQSHTHTHRPAHRHIHTHTHTYRIVISKLAERLFLEICRQPESRVRGSNNKGDVAKLIFNSTPRSSLACAPLSPSFLKHAHCSCTDFDSLLLRSSMTLFTRWRTAVSSTSVVSHRCCG